MLETKGLYDIHDGDMTPPPAARSVLPNVRSLSPPVRPLMSPSPSSVSKSGLRERKGTKYSRLVTPTLGKQRRETNILKLKSMAQSQKNTQDDDNRSSCTTRSRINADTKLRDNLINKFFNKMKDNSTKNTAVLTKILQKAAKMKTPFSEIQTDNLNGHMCMDMARLNTVLNTYKITNDWEKVKDELFEIANISIDGMSVMSPTGGIRTKQYMAFRALLNSMIECYRIRDKQFNMFIELFAHEDFNTLAAYEVYCLTNDLEDFVDTLFSIEMWEQQEKRIQIIDDTEDNREQKEKQFAVLFKYKEVIPPTVFRDMASAIQGGNTGIQELEAMRRSGQLTQQGFITNLVNFGKQISTKKAEQQPKTPNRRLTPPNTLSPHSPQNTTPTDDDPYNSPLCPHSPIKPSTYSKEHSNSANKATTLKEDSLSLIDEFSSFFKTKGKKWQEYLDTCDKHLL
jgi:hypothetical protein